MMRSNGDAAWGKEQMESTCKIGVVAALCFLSFPSEAKSGNALQYPMAIQGIWMNDDPSGRNQCAKFKATLAKDQDEARNFLVGSQVVENRFWHSYAEYGEGNVYFVRGLKLVGKQQWRATAAVGIDTFEELQEQPKAVFRFRLSTGKLIWAAESFGGKPERGQPERRFFRCAAVPKGLYGR
jgi:hypothetical protein